MGYSANATIAFGWYPDLEGPELDIALGLATDDDDYVDSLFSELCYEEKWDTSLHLNTGHYGDLRAEDNKLFLYVVESELRGDEWSPVAVHPHMERWTDGIELAWRLKIIELLKSRFNYTPKAEEIGWHMTVFYG